ncbi:MAG: PAS domain-containing sensor histidine kinase [Candidatus Hydrogenedentes bacterium]|nr:PAS domain-containing sensor histidine kinase [Candidatus Hydrogenedentota bacterium]
MDLGLQDATHQAMALGWFACSTLLVAGFSLSAGVSHFFDWLYQKRDEDSLAFSFICLGVAGHAIALVFLYRAQNVAAYVLALKIDLCCLFAAQSAFVWFVTAHLRVKARKITLLFAAYFAFLFIANLLSKNSLMASEVSNLLLQTFPGGGPYVSAILVPSLWNPFCLVGTFATYAYCLYILFRGRRNLDRGEATAMAVSLAGLFGTWIQVMVNDTNLSSVVVLSHYAFLAFIFLMESAMSSRYGRQTLSLTEAHAALRESEERFRVLVEKAPDAIIVYDLEQDRFVDANPNAELLFGCSRSELLGSGLQRFQMSPLPPAESIRALGARALAGQELAFEQAFHNLQGKNLICEVRLAQLPSAERRLVRASLIDISERKRAENDQFEYQQRLRSLASELAVTEERERKQIAMYLHDEVAQGLVAARLKFGEVATSAGANGSNSQLTEIQELLDHAVEQTYSLTFELSLPILHGLGLMPAVGWLGEKICESKGIDFKLVDDGTPKPLGNDIRGACYYVVRELLVNVVKHAKASKVVVTAQVEESQLRLVVQDDGVGFDVSAPAEPARRDGGFGMFGLRERIEYLSGTIQFESEHGHGTRVTLCVPLDMVSAAAGTD